MTILLLVSGAAFVAPRITHADDGGYVDTYGDNGGYVDTLGSNGGYVDTYGDNGGYVDTSGYTATPVYDTMGGYTATPVYSYTPAYDTSYGYSPAYAYADYAQPFFSASFATPFVVTAPTSFARTVSSPTNINQPTTITNTNNGNTLVTNSGNTNVSISSVNTVPVTPVSYTPVTYPVQYVYPTTYPTYYPSNYNYYSAPYCTITMSNSGYGNTATLSWYSSNTNSAYISPNIGSVAASGSMTVYPGTTLYTMGVSGLGGSNSCQTGYTSAAPYVALSQIPYTGFDFGPVGNALYWISLLSFAVAGAYLLIYYKGGVVAFAGEMVGRVPLNKYFSSVSSKRDEIDPIQRTEGLVTVLAKSTSAPVFSPRGRGLTGQAIQDLPTADPRRTTSDAMLITHSKSGEVPRIVITRS